MTDQPKTTIITGAGSGVGRATAIAFLNAGWRVALAGRREQPLVDTIDLCDSKDAATKSLVVPTDVTRQDSVASLFQQTVERFGNVDLLFNNAGIGAPSVPLEELTVDQWQNVVDVNLTGVFLCLQQAFRVMQAQTPQGGRIINNGSISAHVPRPNSIPYTATKHAVTGITRAAALDGRKHNIAVGQIDIGNAATEMTQRMSKGVAQADGSTGTEPTMDVDHVANSILQMAELPLESNIQFMTIMATKMPYIGRG